jgi:aminotransferase
MHDFCNAKAKDLKQGAIRELFDRARQYTGTINLGIGEPDFETPASIIEAGCKALKNGNTHYTENAGLIELRESIAHYLKRPGVDYSPEKEIIVTNGGMGALSLFLLCTVTPGDEVVVQDPQWLNYRSQILFAGGVPLPVPVIESNRFSLKAEDIEKRITAKTRILMLNSPNNPTGSVIPYEDLKQIAELAVRHDLLVLSDEVYCELMYDGVVHHSITEFPGMAERTMVVNSFSKSFAMTGWRVGFAAGPASIIRKMVVLQENMVACVASVSQYAAIEALKDFAYIDEMRKIYIQRRELVVNGLNSIPGISCIKPEASFYVFPNVKALHMTSKSISDGLLEKVRVVAIPGSAFGDNGEGYLRISYANSTENITEALQRIKHYVTAL